MKGTRRYPASFSEVILRARWPEDTITGAELLARYRRGAHFSEAELDAMEVAKAAVGAPEDKWATR